MDCNAAREILSAHLDGEATDDEVRKAEAHSTRCPTCQHWTAASAALHRRVRVSVATDIPDLTPSILAAIGRMDEHGMPSSRRSGERRSTSRQRANAGERADASARACRIVLACCAALQLLATVPAFLGTVGGPVHLDHELGAWDLALAAGLLIAAVEPKRAWGMVPLVGAVVVALAVTSVGDVLSGHTSVGNETTHVLELIGLFFLWSLARLQRTSPTTATI